MSISRLSIAILVSASCFVLIYFGAILPVYKGQLYISLQFQLRSIKTLQDFEDLFDRTLSFYSPIGQDEVVQGYLGTIMNVLQQNPAPSNEATYGLALGAEKWGEPLMAKGKSFNYGQIIYSLGAVYKLVTVKLQSLQYYKKSVAAFENGLEHSPGRASFLYNLFDLYTATGDNANAKRIGEMIVHYYPSDQNTKDVLKSLK